MIIQLENIYKSYSNTDNNSTLEILKNISLEVNNQKSIAITGPSGCGKSTLLNLMGTLDNSDSGKITIMNEDIGAYSNRKLSQLRNSKIGFVFQLHHLLPQLNVLENVLLPTIPLKDKSIKNDSENRALELLEKVGLSDKIYSRPGQLSGGECQRVAVVRALINKPSLILADEPTGSLDEDSSNKIGDLLYKLNKEENVALVVVTHSNELAKKMDKVYTLSNGKLLQKEL